MSGPTRFPLPSGRLGFDGSLLFSQVVAGADTTVYGFPMASYRLSKTDGIYRPSTADANANKHLENLGIRYGTLEFTAPVVLDRGVVPFIAAAFNNATRANSFDATLTPFSGAVQELPSFLWWRRVTLYGQSSVSGQQNMVMIRGEAWVLDPDNVQGVAALAAPGTLGSSGAGITPFSRTSLTDTTTPTPLDYKMTQFTLTIDNNAVISPTMVDTTHRLSEGCVMGQKDGQLTAQQNYAATNALPKATGHYNFALNLPTGDASHTASYVLNTSYNEDALPILPMDFVRGSTIYGLFNPTNGQEFFTGTYA